MGKPRYSDHEEIERLTREVADLKDRVNALDAPLQRWTSRTTMTTDYRPAGWSCTTPTIPAEGKWVWVPKTKTYRHTFHINTTSRTCPMPDGITIHGQPVVWDRVEEL